MSTPVVSDHHPRLSLLWGDRDRSRGGRHDLTVTRIVTAAVALADEAGLHEVSMRKVAHRLGIGTMSLYTYLPGRRELVDVMIDTVHAGVAAPGHQPHHGWRLRLASAAGDDYHAHLRHPWLLETGPGHHGWGPGSVAKYDRELSAIDGIGLSDSEMATVVSLTTAHVAAAARRRLAASEPAWPPARWADAATAPVAARVADSTGDDAFDFGVQRILDGVGALIRSRP